MRYTFDLYIPKTKRVLTDSNASKIPELVKNVYDWKVEVTDNLTNGIRVFTDIDLFQEYLEALSRNVWRDASCKKAEAIALEKIHLEKLEKKNVLNKSVLDQALVDRLRTLALNAPFTLLSKSRDLPAEKDAVAAQVKATGANTLNWQGPAAPVDKVKEAVSPSHYKAYMQDMQWLEAMQYLPNFRDPSCFKAAVELQARKYLDRLGKKDIEHQEILKSIFYLRFLAAYIANGNKPIKIKDIPGLID
jgi:hypothetical protein